MPAIHQFTVEDTRRAWTLKEIAARRGKLSADEEKELKEIQTRCPVAPHMGNVEIDEQSCATCALYLG